MTGEGVAKGDDDDGYGGAAGSSSSSGGSGLPSTVEEDRRHLVEVGSCPILFYPKQL